MMWAVEMTAQVKRHEHYGFLIGRVSLVSRMSSSRTCWRSFPSRDQMPSNSANQRPSTARRMTVARAGSMPSRLDRLLPGLEALTKRIKEPRVGGGGGH